MNNILSALAVIAVIYLIGAILERWSWSKPLAVLCFLALTAESVWLFLR